ncbi:MAG: cation:proton antiporter [Thermodesulfobacteriota bacterium]|nr:cation:proton antiporter [Thermodesulfobacteriota bacterium]
MESFSQIIFFGLGFAVVAIAAKQIGQYFLKLSLPLISGFLFTGILVGPYGLELIPAKALPHLRFVDQFALAFIAFAAGSELYIKDLKDRLKSIQWITVGLVVSTFLICGPAVFLLSALIPFMNTMPPGGRLAVSILASSILMARSPSSVMAVVNELRAKGPFTQTVIGVTMITDVVVITLFATNIAIANGLLTGMGIDISFLALLLAELLLSLTLGYVLGYLLKTILSLRLNRNIKTLLVVLSGYGVFVLSAGVRHYTYAHMPFEILLEPLLICMIGGFLVTNYCNSRMEFATIMRDTGTVIYIAFFTLTGASLTLDVLVRTWHLALALLFIRMGAIYIGAFAGGLAAGEPMAYNRLGWMPYITQAGVSLGLAKAVAVEFPAWGEPFATTMIAIIVLNQLIGPPLLKQAISWIGEARVKAEKSADEGVRKAMIFGLEDQSLALARLLKSQAWEVSIVSPGGPYNNFEATDIPIRPVPDLSLESLRQVNAEQASTIITMLTDDENYHICELAYEHLGTDNLVVRLTDRANIGRFNELGALIVDPCTAIVNLLDQFVRTPSAASLLLGMDESQDVVELELRNPNLHGIALKDLRLPLDTIVLSIRRQGQMLISHGFTRLEVGDWVTIVGPSESLKEVALRFDTNREHALVQLVGKVTAKELAGKSLASDVQQILRSDANAPAQQKSEKTGHRQAKDRFDRFVEESIVLDLDGPMDARDLFRTVAEAMADRLNTPPGTLHDLLIKREQESSTAISKGLAIPHIIIEGQHKFSILLARCRQGVHFSDSAPMVYAVFVLAGTRDERNFHLQALSAIAQIVQNPNFEKRWFRARGTNALRNVVLLSNRKRQI